MADDVRGVPDDRMREEREERPAPTSEPAAVPEQGPPPAEIAPTPPVIEDVTPVVEEGAPPPESIPILSQETKYRDEPATPVAPPPSAVPAPVPSGALARMPSAGARMREVMQTRKRERLDKVVTLAARKRVITNNDVEKLLKVSDATATNYLRELVRTGRLKKVGVRAGTRYEPA